MSEAVDPLLVLCGGMSTRMGQNKALLPYQTQTLLSRLAHGAEQIGHPLWLSAGAHPYEVAPVAAWVPDALPGNEGPLSAILGGLQKAQDAGLSGLYVMACDTLMTPAELVQCLQDGAGRSPIWQAGLVALSTGEQCMPLLSHWSSALAAPLTQYTVTEGQRRVMGFVRQLMQQTPPALAQVPMPRAWHALSNFNTMHDFERATEERTQYDATNAH